MRLGSCQGSWPEGNRLPVQPPTAFPKHQGGIPGVLLASVPPCQPDACPPAVSLSPGAAPQVPPQPHLPGGVGGRGALVGDAGR